MARSEEMMMESGGAGKLALEEAISRIQESIVATLGLKQEVELSPQLEFKNLEVVRRDGSEGSFTSYDLVDVIGEMEVRFEEDDLLEEFLKEFQKKEFTIESMASFLLARVGMEKIRALPRATA